MLQGARLEQALQDCATANILLGLSNSAAMAQMSGTDTTAAQVVSGVSCNHCADTKVSCGSEQLSPSTKNLEYNQDDLDVADVPLLPVGCVSIDKSKLNGGMGQPKLNSVKPTIHWKNGYTLDRDGQRRNLTPDELDIMRRERNRLHAKMTRDRKKLYVEALSRAISNLEDENQRVRDALHVQLTATQSAPKSYLVQYGVNKDCD